MSCGRISPDHHHEYHKLKRKQLNASFPTRLEHTGILVVVCK